MTTGNTDSAQIEQLRAELATLARRVDRLSAALETHRELAESIRKTQFWDFTPYEVVPDDSWLAIDRSDAVDLLRALAATDHWQPWTHSLTPRGAI